MKRIISLLLVLAMVLVALSACAANNGNTADNTSPGDNTQDSTSTPDDTSKPDDTDDGNTETENNRMDYIDYVAVSSIESASSADVWSADYLGYYEANNIRFSMDMSNSTDAVKMVLAGTADCANPNPSWTLSLADQGGELYSVWSQCGENIFGFYVLEDSPLKGIPDFAGKTIASTNQSSNAIYDPVLNAAGVDPADVNWVYSTDQRQVMLQEGTIDVAYTWQGEWQLWYAQGIKGTFFSGADYDDRVMNSIVFTKEFCETNEDLLLRFLTSLVQGTYFMINNTEAAAAIIVDRFPAMGITAEQANTILQTIVRLRTPEYAKEAGILGYQSLEGWESWIEVCKEYDYIAKDSTIKAEDIVKNEYITKANELADFDAVAETAKNFDVSTVSWASLGK